MRRRPNLNENANGNLAQGKSLKLLDEGQLIADTEKTALIKF